MSPPVAVVESRSGTLGRLPQREALGWASVVARYTRDDWPPPEWRAVMPEGRHDPYEAVGIPVPEEGRAAA